MKVGMFRTNKKPRALARTVAYVCNYYNIDFFYFTNDDVDIENETISGLFFEHGVWVRKTTDYPEVIDNEPNLIFQEELYNSLSKKSVLTSYKIGSKQKVFNMLKKDGRFDDILIPSKVIKTVSDIEMEIDKHQHILLKPSKSNQGKNIYTVRKVGTEYEIGTDDSTEIYHKEDFIQFCNDVIFKKVYLSQPFISSKTKEGFPFDVRINTRRSRNGEWSTVRIYPKIGIGQTITSNIHQGGGISSINPFLQSQFGDRWKEIKNNLKQLSKSFPPYFQSFYDNPIDALGIDFGIDPSGKLWLFEVNTYPGSRYFRVEDAERRVQYYLYCAEKGVNRSN